MRLVVLAGAFALITPLLAAQTITTARQNQSAPDRMQVLPLHIGGRVQIQPMTPVIPPDAPRAAYRHQWPGVYFEAAFEGDAVVLKFDDPVNEYRLIIDDMPPIPLAQPGKAEVTIADLSGGPHRLRLEKVTESIWMLGRFEGFYVAPDARMLPVSPRPRQIEFIGDSDMTGYGLRSDTRTCTQEQVRLRSDTQAAYPALVARHFDADYQINAISGRGIVRNYDGMAPDHTMAAVYENILPDESANPAPYADTEWQPQIIIIGLGNNDFASPLQPAEPWATHDALIDSYIAGMEAFVTTLQGSNPAATLMIYWPDTGILTKPEKARLDREGQSRLTQTAQQLGLKPLQFFTMEGLDLDALGCDFHASASDNRKKAKWLINRMASNPALWVAD